MVTAVLGRDPACDVVFAAATDVAVSSTHAEITTQDDGQLLITDLGSTNGVWIDGERINAPTVIGKREVRLGSDGPSLRIGEPSAMPETMIMQAPKIKSGVGHNTLVTAIATERKRSRRTLTTVAAAFVIILAVAAAIALRHNQDRVKKSVGRKPRLMRNVQN